MKNVITGILLGLTLVGCSKQESSSVPDANRPIETLEAKSASVTSLNFGDVAYDKTVLLSVTITNNGTETLSGSPSITSSVAGAFSIPYVQTTSCDNLAVSKTCLIKISLNAKLLTAGAKTETLSYASLSFPVSANILAAPAAAKTVTMPTEVDFGTMTTSQSILKTVSITNTSSVSLLEAVTVSPPFVLSYNGCTASLLPGKSCSVKVSLSGSSGAGTYQSHVLSYGAVGSSALKGIIQSPEQVAALNSNVVAVYSSQNLAPSSTTSLGTLLQNSSQLLTVLLKNIGTGAATVSSLGFSSTQMSFSFNSCQGVSLAPGASCTLKINLTPSGATPETLSVTLAHGDVRQFSFSYIFQEMKRLSVKASSKVSIVSTPAGISCSSGTCAKDFIKNSSITLDASPATGYRISAWPAPGSCSLIGSSMVCELSSDISLALPTLACASGYVASGSSCIVAPVGGPLALSNLSTGAAISVSQLSLDSDGHKKFTLNGSCSENGEEIRIVLDEFLGQQTDGMDMASFFCDFDTYDCTTSAEVFATCDNNHFSVKIPLQNLADFYWWWPYGGETNLKAYYVNNPTLGPIDINFINNANTSIYYRQDQTRDWFSAMSVRPSAFIGNYPSGPGPFNSVDTIASDTMSIVLWGTGVRYTNPRNIKYSDSEGYYDYFDENLDANNYPVVGEGKISIGNETCSGGTWIQAATGYISNEISTEVTLPADNSVLAVSYQFRDTVSGDASPCFVRYFQKLGDIVSPSIASVTVLDNQDQVVNSGETLYSSTNSPAPIMKFQVSGTWDTNYPDKIITRLNVYNSQQECLDNGSSLPNAGEVQNYPGPYVSELTTSMDYFGNPKYGQIWVNLETYINGNYYQRTSCYNTGVNTVRGFNVGYSGAYNLLSLDSNRVVGFHIVNHTLTTYQANSYGVSSFGTTPNLDSTVAVPAFAPMSGFWNSDMWGAGSDFTYRVSQSGSLHIVHIPDNFVQYGYEQTVNIPALSACGSYYAVKSSWKANDKLALLCNPGGFIVVIDYDKNTNTVTNSKTFTMPYGGSMYFKDVEMVGPNKLIAVANNQAHTGAIASQSIIFEITDTGSGFTSVEHAISGHLGIEWGQTEDSNIVDGVVLTHSTESNATLTGTISVYQKSGGTYSLFQSFPGSTAMVLSPDGLNIAYYKDIDGSLYLAQRNRVSQNVAFGAETLTAMGFASWVSPRRLLRNGDTHFWYLLSNSMIRRLSY